MKRVNFNMAGECHKLLKATCVLLDVSVSEFCYDCIASRFRELCLTDNRVLNLLLVNDYPKGSRAYHLKEELKRNIEIDRLTSLHG